MPAFAGLQALVYGLGCMYSGFRLCSTPTQFLQQLSPFTSWIEKQSAQRGVQLARSDLGAGPLAFAGLALFAIGWQYMMAVYTLDEKFKRNSTSGRLILAVLSYWICVQTPNGSSLVALFGLVNLVSGLAMGFSVGWGDGNAVDLEIKERIEARRRAAAAKEVARS
ncbi:hypothetical protein JCM10908_003975 [Rhodotorula pacifica]|uniref:uncharacterized protein n=1 Tax=Rhodotorula pacifica TaxID=1495444 RepID=UPI003180DABE